MKIPKYIAKSAEGSGMLPMKQGGEQEAKKSGDQQNEELCNFIKNAFVVNGDVYLTHYQSVFIVDKKPIQAGVFQANDATRGTFFISFTTGQ